MPDTQLEPIDFGGTLPPLYAALLIQLVLKGPFEFEDLDMIATRLEADDMPSAASSVRALCLSIAVEAEHELRKLEDDDDADGGNDND